MSNALLPSVAIVTVNYNGKKYLQSCFESLQQLNYDKDKMEIICVDNGSSDGSAEFIRQNFPNVRCIESGANIGFAAGCNLGAKSIRSDYVAFVNNDATVDQNWLLELVNAISEDKKIVCAAAKMLDSSGQTIDFVESHMNFLGFARQVAWRTEVEPGLFDQRKSILAACGGAMLIHRQIFLEIGGFDENYFMFYEDVDLGWRLWVLGYMVIFVPEAITYHRHHGSAGKVDKYRKQLLYERNALATIIKNYEQTNLDKVLPVALLLAVNRTVDLLQASDITPDILHPHNWNLPDHKLRQTVSLGKLAPILAIRDLSLNMPDILEKRQKVQSQRKRPDQEIVKLFGQPLRTYFAVPQLGGTYSWLQETLTDAFRIRGIFENIGKRVLLITMEGLPKFGFSPTPANLRIEAIGNGLEAKGHEVLYSMPLNIVNNSSVSNNLKKLAWTKLDLEEIVFEVGPDVVIVCNWQLLEYMAASIYRPVVLDHHTLDPKTRETNSFSFQQKEFIANVDLYTCPSENQKESLVLWLKQAGIMADPAMIRVVSAMSADEIEPLHHFCQNPSVKITKSKIKPTPAWGLPRKAWHVLTKNGIKGLKTEINKYFSWRKQMK